MARALRLAALGKASTHPNPRVGCVIVRDGVVVGEGWHARAGEPHAEVHALRAAGEQARGAQVYVTLEPCAHHGRTPPCVNALIAAGVAQVTVAATDPNPNVAGRGIQQLRDAGIAVQVGLCEPEALLLNRGFMSRFRRGRPWVTLKLAASLDGRTAMASGESRWITGPEARADVHRLRAEAGAVLAGADTVLVDDPALSVRDWEPPEGVPLRQPDRIVVDGRARVSATAKVWNNDGARRFRLCTEAAPRVDIPGVDCIAVGTDGAGRLLLPQMLQALAEREVNEVLVEAGARLGGAFLQAGVVDEVLVYMAPVLLGEAARPLALLPGLAQLADAVRLEFEEVVWVGADLRMRLRPQF
jgi:diaminohydroxyphosphoribosylaminopyrimidine deaminase/5-amino-6-(5-phosphoribosylamino)uracil reductase